MARISWPYAQKLPERRENVRKSVFVVLFLFPGALLADQFSVTVVGRALSIQIETRTPPTGPSETTVTLIQRLVDSFGLINDVTSYCHEVGGWLNADCTADNFLGLSCIRVHSVYSSTSTDGTIIHGTLDHCQSPHAGRCQTLVGVLQTDLTINALSLTQTPGGCSC